jgi:serine/threonine protein kinase
MGKNKKSIGHYYIGNLNNMSELFSLEKSIGEGTFGKVKLGTHQLTGEKVRSTLISHALGQ